MRQTYYHLTALPKDSDAEVWIGHTYARRANAVKFADRVRDHFRRVTVWQGGPGGIIFATVYPTGYAYDGSAVNLPVPIANPANPCA